jgi:SAM-dependent methyltransferase/pimeloyl-ACP methyl ester carboxylesterase
VGVIERETDASPLLALGRLYSEAIRARAVIREKLRTAQEGAIALNERAHELGVFRVVHCDDRRIRLACQRRLGSAPETCLFEFVIGSGLYYFVTAVVDSRDDELYVDYPEVLYGAERRDRARVADASQPMVSIRAQNHEIRARIVDRSPCGIGLIVQGQPGLPVGSAVSVGIPADSLGGDVFAEVRNSSVDPTRGWRRVGLSVIPRVGRGSLEHHEINDVVDVPRPVAMPSVSLHGGESAIARDANAARQVPLTEFANSAGQRLVGILDTWGDPRGATAVVIPPAWGRTKETLLPLASTIVRTFAVAEQPVAVLRYDGTLRRGESYAPPGARERGLESQQFTFSQAVADLRAAIAHVRERFSPSRVVLVTFSAAAIEGRRVVAEAGDGSIAGWISVVGATDPQALIRGTQRGVDYFAGYEAGHRYGLQEVQGVVIDVDHAVSDAIENNLAFVDDARRDFAQICVPVTWIHGRHDGWIELERVRDVLSMGDTSRRRLLEVASGHQLRISREAVEVFKVVASDVLRMATGRAVRAVAEDVSWLRARRRAERGRLPRLRQELRTFWKDYLLGRDEGLGIELVAATTSYRGLMEDQIDALAVQPGERVIDLGSGVGTFVRYLLDRGACIEGLRVAEVDYVLPALRRAQVDLERRCSTHGVRLECVEANLDLDFGQGVPFASESVNAVIASLLINYVRSPLHLLREVRRVLVSSGRLVLSSLKPDADISRICVDGIAELRTGVGRRSFGSGGERRAEDSLAGFVNDATRLLDFEERGLFGFWERDDLVAMLAMSGFECISIEPSFGVPPQAVVIVARPA